MVEIKIGDKEVSISGGNKALKVLSVSIRKFAHSNETRTVLASITPISPAPYQNAAEKLELIKSPKCIIRFDDDTLYIEGCAHFFMSLANNIPFDVSGPYHVHYDYISFPQFLTPDSAELVLEITDK